MNWVNQHKTQLETHNYVLKADAGSNYWFGLSKNKIDELTGEFGENFNIILYGDENAEAEFLYHSLRSNRRPFDCRKPVPHQ